MWRSGLGAFLVVASTLVACSGARQRATEPPRAIKDRNTDPALDAAFALPATTLPSAPWLEAPLAAPRSCEVDMLQTFGENTAFDRPPYVDDTLSCDLHTKQRPSVALTFFGRTNPEKPKPGASADTIARLLSGTRQRHAFCDTSLRGS